MPCPHLTAVLFGYFNFFSIFVFEKITSKVKLKNDIFNRNIN